MTLLDRLRTYGRDTSAPGPAEAALTATYGNDGESYQSYGQLYSGGPDVNPLLAGRNKYLIYDEMRRSDPAVKSLLWMFKLPIRSAVWGVDAAQGGKDPTDRVIAEAVERQFGLGGREGRLDLSWDDSLSQALLKLDWGAMFEEMLFGDLETWYDDEGGEHTWRPLNRLAPRSPSTIFMLNDDPDTGKLTEVVQDVPLSEPIPGWKVCAYVLEREGRNWWGTSLLRSCFGPWKLKKGLMIASGIGWDRFSGGVPLVRYPVGGGDQARQRAEQIGRNYRTHERAWIALEGPPPEKGGNWGVEILGMNGTLPDPTNLLRHYDGQIAHAGLQMFTKLGSTETGSRAVGEALGEPFYMAAQSIAGAVGDARTKQAVRAFVDVNFGPEYDTPRLTVSRIQAKSIELMAAAIANLASAGLSFTDRDTQNELRDQMDMPQLPEDLALTVNALPDNVGLEHTPPGGLVKEGDGITPPTTDISPTA